LPHALSTPAATATSMNAGCLQALVAAADLCGGGTLTCASQVRGEAAHIPRAGKRSEAERCEGRGCAAAARSRALHRCAAKPCTSPSRKAQRSGAVRGTRLRGGGTLTCASQVRGEAAHVPSRKAQRSGAVRGTRPRGGGTLTCASQVRGEAAHIPEQESAAKRSGARDDSAHPKVLQRFALPVWKPVENQCVRSAEEPCVHVSGLTCPCVACWMRSSPTAAAALSASFTSASVIFVR